MTKPREVSEVHTRLLRATLLVEESRAYWQRADPEGERAPKETVFEEYWFGAKSMPSIELILANLRLRYDAFPEALRVLHRWTPMEPETRTLICHWHLQLADPTYRAFTGAFLPSRRVAVKPEVHRDRVVKWVAEQQLGKWTMSTRLQYATKLLTSAYQAGLVAKNRDPRPLAEAAVPDDALSYLLYLLRTIEFEGTMVDNPYLASVGLTDRRLEDRLRRLPDVSFRRMGDLADFEFRFPHLVSWAEATL